MVGQIRRSQLGHIGRRSVGHINAAADRELKTGEFLICGTGPDGDYSFGNETEHRPFSQEYCLPYHASNGLVSGGDTILREGGGIH